MILYLDTSSLVKLYLVEPGSENVRRLVEQSELVSTSVLIWPSATGFAASMPCTSRPT